MSKKPDLNKQVNLLQKVSAGVFMLLAVAAVVLMNQSYYQITIGHLAKDTLASQGGGTVLAPAVRSLFDVQIRYIVAVILGISALVEVLAVTRWRAAYEKAVKNNVIPGRWIKLAVVGALTVEAVALLNGINDILTLKLIGGLVAATALLGWISERQNKGAKKPIWLAFGLSIFTGLLPWLIIAASAVGTVVYGMERSGWHVYALSAAVLGSFALVTFNQWRQYNRKGQWKDYWFIERNYVVIELVTKTAFAAILIFALKR